MGSEVLCPLPHLKQGSKTKNTSIVQITVKLNENRGWELKISHEKILSQIMCPWWCCLTQFLDVIIRGERLVISGVYLFKGVTQIAALHNVQCTYSRGRLGVLVMMKGEGRTGQRPLNNKIKSCHSGLPKCGSTLINMMESHNVNIPIFCTNVFIVNLILASHQCCSKTGAKWAQKHLHHHHNPHHHHGHDHQHYHVDHHLQPTGKKERWSRRIPNNQLEEALYPVSGDHHYQWDYFDEGDDAVGGGVIIVIMVFWWPLWCIEDLAPKYEGAEIRALIFL